MFSGWILADKVLTWEQIHFKINFWKKKKKKEKSLSTVRFWAESNAVDLVRSNTLSRAPVPALRVSSAHSAPVPTEEPTWELLSLWKRQVSPTSSAECNVGLWEQPPCLQETGLEDLVLLGAAAGTGVRAQDHSLAPCPWERFDDSSFTGLLLTSF